MDLNALRLFVQVVQQGSFSKAAEKTGVPIATISRQIGELEKALHIQLFDRLKSGVKPTVAGVRLYDEVQLSITHLLNAQNVLTDDQHNLVGRLRISAPPNYEPALWLIHTFSQRYPHIQVHCTLTERLQDLTADGVDVAFRFGNLHTDSVIAKKVGNVSAKLVAHPSLLAKLGTPQQPMDLYQFPCAGWAKSDDKYLYWQLGEHQLALPYLFASNDNYAIALTAQRGQAICQVADFMAERLIAEYGLVEVLADYVQPSYPIHLIYPAHRYLSSIVRAFVDFCGEHGVK